MQLAVARSSSTTLPMRQTGERQNSASSDANSNKTTKRLVQ